MPTWSGILRELGEAASSNKRPDFDGVRRKYLHALHLHTERQTILYASGWLQKEDAPAASTSINEEDIHALMEVTAGMSGSELDLILHSPGGSVDAAESIVSYLRSRFSDIRVIIPHLAMSAATMIACAADKIVMGKHSFLGPTDPQFLLTTPLGIRSVPAQAVLDQFEKAKRECADPAKLSAWLPMLEQYGPDLLERSEMALELSKTLVKEWLKTYMFESADDSESLAESVSTWLAPGSQNSGKPSGEGVHKATFRTSIERRLGAGADGANLNQTRGGFRPIAWLAPLATSPVKDHGAGVEGRGGARRGRALLRQVDARRSGEVHRASGEANGCILQRPQLWLRIW